MHGAKSFEAAPGGFELGEATAFLLDQIIFSAANGFRYTSYNRKGRRRVTLTCSNLSENSRAEFKIRRPYAREVAISDVSDA